MSLAELNLPPITFKRAKYYRLGRNAPLSHAVNHRMVGTLPGTDRYFTLTADRSVSTTFGIGFIDGRLAISQYVPLDDTAFGNGNYDPSGNWDDWGNPLSYLNDRTFNIEHQDHDGTTVNKGIVKPEVQEASKKLQALILRGTPAEWRAAGIVLRDWDNAAILQRELASIPLDGRHIINHNDIAGRLKPDCWKPWAMDTVGFPRSAYVTGITNYVTLLRHEEEPMGLSLQFTDLTPGTVRVTPATGRAIARVHDRHFERMDAGLLVTSTMYVGKARLSEPLNRPDLDNDRQTVYVFNYNGTLHVALAIDCVYSRVLTATEAALNTRTQMNKEVAIALNTLAARLAG